VKRRILIGGLILLMLGCLMMSFITVYPNMALDTEIAAAFPDSVSGLQLITQGSGILPLALMPALNAVSFREGLLLAGILLTVLGGLLSMVQRKGISHIAAALGCAGMLPMLLFSFYMQQLDQSILFDVMLTTKWVVWAPAVLSVCCLRLRRLPCASWSRCRSPTANGG